MSYSSPANSKKVDPAAKQLEQQIKLLEAILKRPGNDNCADCGQKGPRWASINLGIFVCIRCSGIHRNMGTHISKVKSVSLDKWAPEMIRTVDVIGNLNAKRIYEGKCSPNYPRPRESDTYGVEQWIRDKYDRKRFYDAAAAAEILAGISAAGNSPQPKQQTSAVDEDQARKLRREQRRKQRELEAEKSRNSPQQVQQYTPAPAPVAAPSVDLLLGGPSVPQQQSPQVQQQFVPQQQFVSQQQFTPSSADAFFSEFQTSSTPATFQTNSQAAFFQEPTPQVQAPPEPVKQPEPPKASKEQILSLFKADQNPSNNTGGLFSLNGFGSPVQTPAAQTPNYAALNSMGMGNNMGVYGMNTMGMNNMGGYGMNTMGMNPGMNTMGMNNMNAYGMNGMGMNNGMNTMGNTMGMNGMGMNNLSGFNTYGNAGVNMNAAVRPATSATPSTNTTWGGATNNGLGMGFGTVGTPASTQNNNFNFNW